MLFWRIAATLTILLAAPLAAAAQTAAGEGVYLGMRGDTAVGEPGVRVLEVVPGGPAANAQFEEGDLIVALDGTPIANVDDLSQSLGVYAVGDEIEFEVMRGGRLFALPIRLGPVAGEPAEALVPEELPVPGAAQLERGAYAPPLPPENDRALLGVHVVPLTGALRSRLGVAARSGVVIDTIQQGSPADIYRLPLGGVIIAVDDARISQPADLVAVIAGRQPGERVAIRYWNGQRLLQREVVLAPGGVPRVEDPPLVMRPEAAQEHEELPALPAPGGTAGAASDAEELRRIGERLLELRAQSAAIREEIDQWEEVLEQYLDRQDEDLR